MQAAIRNLVIKVYVKVKHSRTYRMTPSVRHRAIEVQYYYYYLKTKSQICLVVELFYLNDATHISDDGRQNTCIV